MKTKNFIMVLSFCRIATSPDRTEHIFQVGCFNFAQMKASVELYINKLSDAVAKSELKLIAKSLIAS